MAREIGVIQQEMLDKISINPNLQDLNSTSKVAIYRLFTYIIAAAIWSLEKLFDIHKTEIDTAIYEYKPGTSRWYRNMALAFQYGFNLLPDDDQFDNTGYSDEQIATSKIIKYCSIREGIESSRVVIKIAGETSDNLHELSNSELISFTNYMKEVSYAGVKLTIINNPADKLLVTMDVYVNALIFDTSGTNILTGEKTVELALKSYIKNLPFDGELIINDLIAYLRAVEGVNNVNIIQAQSSFKENGVYKPFSTINVSAIPMAGYFEIEPTSLFNYVV